MSATSTTTQATALVTSHAAFALLPAEIVESIQHTYFLHLLVNDPNKVVPAGKSVLSMMQHADFRLPEDQAEKKDEETALLERVKDAAHKAFWTEALEVLSSPIPSVQIPRLKRLHLDLLEALTPLFPPNHMVLLTLAAPPPPTTSPLLSTVSVLTHILSALRQRCAPIRDTQIDVLLASASLPPTLLPAAPSQQESSDPQISPLSQFVVDNVKAILSLAEDMKADLNNFILGSMTEDQLHSILSSTVKSRERETVLQLWDGQDSVRSSWRSWLAEGHRQPFPQAGSRKWIDRLLKALESDQAVFCVPPSALDLVPDGTTPVPDVQPNDSEVVINKLPPQLFYLTPALLYLQNYLQAITITAALRLLSRPAHQAPNAANSTSSDLAHRVWALLFAEVESDDPHYSDTKVINLADEVIRARQQSNSSISSSSSLQSSAPPIGGSISPEEEARIRASVDRTLRSTDPVFLLLRKRLLDALEIRLLADVGVDGGRFNHDSFTATVHNSHSIPTKMQTGRDLSSNGSNRAGKRPKLGTHIPSQNLDVVVPAFNVQGFDDPILEQAISIVYRKLIDSIVWTESVWGDLV
ncbi:hypothetical protein CPB83DRAFT_789917 [Crepidotus variabilis]|uniref:Uncharacterized protein n=1 Tax=Crepidotus variabilis TaxID=179855 RepID=A0A9P6EI89_9AGAR|nr:hypothetical protein CPB83DRAFT_789917 [Crepidotus variabilis]